MTFGSQRAGGEVVVMVTFAMVTICTTACGPQSLQGSLTEIMDLGYKTAEIGRDSSAVAVRFQTPQGAGQNIVLEVAARLTDGVQVTPGFNLDLAEPLPDGLPRGVVTRNVFDDERRTFPLIGRGKLKFLQPIATGATVSGSFSVTFTEGITFASGRTVYGSFTATVP